MARLDDAEQVQPSSRAEWRKWLAANHDSSPGVWLVSFTKASGRQQLAYEDVIEELRRTRHASSVWRLPGS